MSLITTAPVPLCFLSVLAHFYAINHFSFVYCLPPPPPNHHPPTMSLHLHLCSFLVAPVLSIFRRVDQQQKAQLSVSVAPPVIIIQYCNIQTETSLSHTCTCSFLSEIRFNLHFTFDTTEHSSHSYGVTFSNSVGKAGGIK